MLRGSIELFVGYAGQELQAFNLFLGEGYDQRLQIVDRCFLSYSLDAHPLV
jgi:hypothetical protein